MAQYHPSLKLETKYSYVSRSFSGLEPLRGVAAPFKRKDKGFGDRLFPSNVGLNFADYSYSVRASALSYAHRSDYSGLRRDKEIPDSLKWEVERFSRCLDEYMLTPGNKRYDRAQILSGSLMEGPDYADKISDEWDYGIRRSHCIRVFGVGYDEWKPIVHYNELPPVSCLINWIVPKDDISYMQIPVGEIPLYQEFKETLENMLRGETLEPVSDVEVFSVTKTSSSFDVLHKKRIPMYKSRILDEGRTFQKNFQGIRTIVPIAAGNVRDTVVTSIATYNTIKWCDLTIGRLLDLFPASLINSNSSIFERRLAAASKYQAGNAYYLRDIKKCGLTFPRELFRAVREVLESLFKDQDFSRFRIFDSYELWDNDMKLIPDIHRGYCLGMANNLVTLCQCVIFDMIQSRIHAKLRGYFGNDDSIISFENTEDANLETLELLAQVDSEVMTGLGIIINPSKTFFSSFPIIFEQYGKMGFQAKESRVACVMAAGYMAPSIKYAKAITNSLSYLVVNKEHFNECLRRLTEFWGYDYFPREGLYDYQLGGWISKHRNFCSTLLEDIYLLEEDEVSPAFRAMNIVSAFERSVVKRPPDQSSGDNWSGFGQLMGIISIDEKALKNTSVFATSLMMTKKQYEAIYSNLYKFARKPEQFLREQEKILQKEYNRVRGADASITDIINLVSRRNPLAIPKEHVYRHTNDFNVLDKLPELNPVIRRNCLARYLELLRLNGVVRTFQDTPIHHLYGDEYEDYMKYHPNRENTAPFYCNDQDDSALLQYSTNPYLVLTDYITTHGQFPLEISRWTKPHDPIPDYFFNEDIGSELHLFLSRFEREIGGSIDIPSLLSEIEVSIEQRPPSTDDRDLCEYHKPETEDAMGPWVNGYFEQSEDYCEVCNLIKTVDTYSQTSQTGRPEDRAIRTRIFEISKVRLQMLAHSVGLQSSVDDLTGHPPDIFDDSNSEEGFVLW